MTWCFIDIETNTVIFFSFQLKVLIRSRNQYETEIQIVQVKYESECIAHQNTEKLMKMYETKAKNLEMDVEVTIVRY